MSHVFIKKRIVANLSDRTQGSVEDVRIRGVFC